VARVQIKGLRKTFGQADVLHGVDLDIASGEFRVFVGPSGCGKTTTLRMIAGLETPSAGEIWIDDIRADGLPPADRGVAMVFQNYALYPHMSTADNMGFSLKVSGASRSSMREAVGRAAEILHISHLLDRLPAQLSGGERQRVAIGRAIVRQPKVFLFDEPLSNLDAGLRTQMRLELSRLHEALGTTMVYVTHDQTEAMTLGQRVALFEAGRVVQDGPPLDLYRAPVNLYAAGFLGAPRMNLLPLRGQARAADDNAKGFDVAVFAPLLGHERIPGQAAWLGVRPECWQVVELSESTLRACIDRVEHLGDSVILHCLIEGLHDLVSVRHPAGTRVPEARTGVGLSVQWSDCHWFDASGNRIAIGAGEQSS
jgi:multiple sugar transport system ATP-binding protein